jgi:hypothetical protein
MRLAAATPPPVTPPAAGPGGPGPSGPGTPTIPGGFRGPGGNTPGQSWDDVMPVFGTGTSAETIRAAAKLTR